MIFRSEEGLTSVNTDNSVQKKCNEAFQGVYFLRIREKNLKSHLVLVVVLVRESKVL